MQIATTTHTRNSRLIGCGREEAGLADRAGAAMAVDIRGSRGETARRSRHAAAHPNGSHGREEAANSAAVFDGRKRSWQHFLLPNRIFENYLSAITHLVQHAPLRAGERTM